MGAKLFGGIKMGAKLFVSGDLYCKDDDGNFVKMMTVTNIETKNIDSCGDEIRVGIKVDGYAIKKIEKEEPGRRWWIGSAIEKWDCDNYIYFMIFDGAGLSIKINRNDNNYNYPYVVTAYKNGAIISTDKYETWQALECMFLYKIGVTFNASFTPTFVNELPRMLRNARRIVRYNGDMDLTFRNGSYLRKDTPMTVSSNIDKVIFDDPATVVLWKDGTRTVVHTQDGEPYDKEKGFAMAVCKKIFGNERDYYHVFKRWFRKGEDRSKNKGES